MQYVNTLPAQTFMSISTSLKKSLIVMFSMALLFFAGHHYIYMVTGDMLREVCVISSSALLGLCLVGSLFLLSDSRGFRLHRVFALQMLIVAIATALTLIRIVANDDVMAVPSKLISSDMLIYGNVYAFILLLYPLELLCCTRMKLGRYVGLFLPAVIMSAFYFVYTRLGDYQMTEIEGWRDLLSNLHKFDIWFRLMILAYSAWLLWVVIRQKKHYADTLTTTGTALRWLNYYLFGYLFILVSYIAVTLMQNYQSIIMNSLTFLIFFCFVFYYILRQKNSNMPRRRDVMGEDSEPLYTEETPWLAEDTTDDKYRFVDKIPQYKSDLERWMQEQRPYRNKSFKLLDVMQVLPLNRSYISRLFNEGYGETFFTFVMNYRIEESVDLLKNQPEMNIRDIADMCGFSSPSVFGRAFLKHKGVTPKQYRDDLGIS